MNSEYDVTVIGSGPGGYVAAIRSAQLGFKTAIVEKYNVLGGTCTNVGCIPSKAMLDSTEHYHSLLHKATKQGIECTNASLNFSLLIDRNRQVVKQNTDGLNYLMKKNKIDVLIGAARFIDKNTIAVTSNDSATKEIRSRYFIIATGSKPASIPGVTTDKSRIITSTEALYLHEQPKTMAIIGGGVIGVELASAYSRAGTLVTIIEYSKRLIPTMDAELGKELKKVLTNLGTTILLDSKVISAINDGKSVTIAYENASKNLQSLTADYCLVAVGRKPYTTGLELQKAAVKTDSEGGIIVNDELRTDQPNIFALGDVVRGPMLAHKAEDEGVAVADTIAGKSHRINYLHIPNVVYTWPEVAGVGYTEEQLKNNGIEFRKGKFPFIASGRARASSNTEGFVKVLSDPKYGEILGVHIIGARAADMIAQAVLAMKFEITDVELGQMPYAHPTFSEALKEAYLAASGRGAINM